MAQWIAGEKEYPVWVPFEGNNLQRAGFDRPPLWNLLEASFLFVFGFHEFIIKFLTPFIAVLSGIALFVLIKKLYNEKVALIASIIFVAIPSFVTYSVLFYTDVLYTFYFLLFVLTFILALKTGAKKYWIVSSVFGALAFLSKTTGYAVYAFVVFVFIYQLIKEKKLVALLKKYSVWILISIVILSTFFMRSFFYYKTPACNLPLPLFKANECTINNFQSKYEFSGITEQVGTEVSPTQMGITNYLNFAYGNIWFVVFGFICGLLLLFLRRNDVDILIILSMATIIFILAQFIQRAEDSARYMLGWAPIIALIAGSFFDGIYDFIKKYQKYIALIVFIIVIIFAYLNLRDKLDTMFQVKQFSPLFFDACNWIKENTPKDSLIFTVWGHRTVYSCQRSSSGNLADISLSKDLNYTLSVAKQLGITHIFIQKFSIDSTNSHLSEKYDLDFVQFLENNPEHFKNIYENGPSLQQCLQQGGCDGNIIYEIIQ
jgi:4-amino-4-deoxy-L-arabinose transferase-like glycosyltransferase